MTLTVEISPQLQNEGFRFCKVAKRDKKPFEQGWSKKGYSYDDPILKSWLESGGNYGVLGGHGDLVIFDADDLARLQELGVIALLPESFTVRTPGRGGWHIYLICPGIEKKMALYDPEKTSTDAKGREQFVHVADLVALGMQAVGPGSIREIPREDGTETRAYEVIKDLPIAHITEEQLKEAIKVLRITPRMDKKKTAEGKEEQLQKAGYRRWSDTLHVEDVLLPENIVVDNLDTTGELQGAHPIHGSETGRNFAINVKKNNWVCFRCHPPEGKGEAGKDYCGGGPWELLGIREGIITCDDCYKGWRRDQPEKWAAILRRARDLGIEVPRLPDGDSMSELRRDIIRYCVEVLMGSEHIRTLHSGEILLYENGVYKFEGDILLGSMIQQLGGPQTTNTVVLEVLGQIRRLTATDFLDFDKDPYRISVKNGILNLNTGHLEPHDPEFLTVIQIPVDFKPGADCPEIKKFMTEIVKDKDMALMEEMAGYCLLRAHNIHKGFLLLGEGRNGKSTWVNLLAALVSLENTSQVPLQHLGRKFKTSELKGKLINFYTDLPDLTVAVTDAFKIVTSGDPMTIEEKYKAPQKMINYSKQVFSANALPKCLDETYGFFSRLILIDFPNRFEGDNADPFLLKKLTTPEELSGFLNLAISGLRRLLQNQHFSYDMSVDDIAEEYQRRSAPAMAVTDFVGATTLKNTSDAVLKEDLWLAYRGWCLENGENELPKESFFKGVYSAYAVSNTRISEDGFRRPALRGLVLSEEGRRLADLGKSISPEYAKSSQRKAEVAG
jgi:P4 family phage/plasmid primase-like protien